MPLEPPCACASAARTRSPRTTGSGSATFDTLKSYMENSPAIRAQFSRGLEICISRHSPSDPGQRFIVGNCGEWILASVIHGAGAPRLLPAGDTARGYDLTCACGGGERWSVKSSYTRGGNFRITNGQGGAGKGMTHSTVFWSPDLPGLVYVDPLRHHRVVEAQKSRADSVQIAKSVLREHAKKQPGCVIGVAIPENRRVVSSGDATQVIGLLGYHSDELPELTALLEEIG
jgi:hypothetical protein